MSIKKRWALPIAALAVFALLVSCVPTEAPNMNSGSIMLALDHVWAKAISPPVPGGLNIDHYILTGINNTNADTLGPLSLSGSFLLENVSAGNWDLTAVARNGNGIPLAEGTVNVDVTIGVTSPASIVCLEYTDGSGTSFAVDLAYEPDILNDPGVQSYLKPFSGPDVDVTLAVDNVACTLTGNYGPPISPGYMTYIVRLYELPNGSFDGSEVLAGGRATAVRFVSGYETQMSGWMHLYSESGMIDLDLSSVLHDELVLTPAAGSPDFSDIDSLGLPPNDESSWVVVSVGDSITFDAESTEAVTTVIYVNGDPVALDVPYVMDTTGAIDGDFLVVDVVAFSIDGERAGSESWIVKFVDFISYDITGSFNTTGGDGEQWIARLYPAPGDYSINERSTSYPAATGPQVIDWTDIPAGTYALMVFCAASDLYEFWEGHGYTGAAPDPFPTEHLTIEIPLTDPVDFAFGNVGP